MSETQNPRPIDDIIDLPYSELTEEEIELVIDYKAQIKARDEQFAARMKAQRQASLQSIQIAQAAAQRDKTAFDNLVNAAYARLETAMGVGVGNGETQPE